MKLEFLAEGSKDCPLIRLYEFDRRDGLRLKELIAALAGRTATNSSLHRQPWIEAIDSCELEMLWGTMDQGVMQTGPMQFEYMLTSEGWTDVGLLLEPLLSGKPFPVFSGLAIAAKFVFSSRRTASGNQSDP